jgi:ADP-L-glycero-D-manno-heptose 6-epimerase
MVVVTGVNGFIGRHLLSALQGVGHGVVGVDRSAPTPGVVEFEAADTLMRALDDPDKRNLRRNIRGVIHLGAITDTTCQDRALLRKYNTEFSMRLWDWCSLHGKPLVYASSAATYGNGEYGFSDSDHVTPLLRPRNPYGQSKHSMDVYALGRSGITSPPSWAALKFFNVYGPGEGSKGPMASMVCHGARQAKNDGEIRLFEGDGGIPDGGHKRDFILVDDVVDVIMWALDAGPIGVVNVGTGEARTFNDLAGAIFSAMGLPKKVSYFRMPDCLREQYQDFTMADVSKLRSLGYRRAFARLEDGVARTISMDYV